MSAANSMAQRGFSLVELIAAIMVIAVLATGFLSAFSVVLKNSAPPLQIGLMEHITASQLDRVLSGTYQSALALPASASITAGGTEYVTEFASSVVASGVHVSVTTTCNGCSQSSVMSGDVYDIW